MKKQKVIGLLVMCAIGLCSCSKGKESVTREAEISRATSALQARSRAVVVNPRVAEVRQGTAEEIEAMELIAKADQAFKARDVYSPLITTNSVNWEAQVYQEIGKNTNFSKYTEMDNTAAMQVLQAALNEVRGYEEGRRKEVLTLFLTTLVNRAGRSVNPWGKIGRPLSMADRYKHAIPNLRIKQKKS
jgi:hypothetical protein